MSNDDEQYQDVPSHALTRLPCPSRISSPVDSSNIVTFSSAATDDCSSFREACTPAQVGWERDEFEHPACLTDVRVSPSQAKFVKSVSEWAHVLGEVQTVYTESATHSVQWQPCLSWFRRYFDPPVVSRW